jgi:phosphoribosylamine--glycine ligase
MGTSMFWAGRNRAFQRTLGRVEAWLADEGYVGSIDLNCIVNAQGVYPLEFTPRFGYPTIVLQEESMNTPTGEFFYRLAHGEEFEIDVHQGYQIAVRVCVPPFPFDDEKTFAENSRNAAIVFETDDAEGSGGHATQSGAAPDGVHIEDTKRVDGQWRVAGESGIVLVVTGKGETMREAQFRAYDRIERIIVPNMYYRDDIGERWIESDGDRLQAWGYLGP